MEYHWTLLFRVIFSDHTLRHLLQKLIKLQSQGVREVSETSTHHQTGYLSDLPISWLAALTNRKDDYLSKQQEVKRYDNVRCLPSSTKLHHSLLQSYRAARDWRDV